MSYLSVFYSLASFLRMYILRMAFARNVKPHTDDQVFLDKFLARVYDEQVFFQQFSLTSFNCSCVTAEPVLLDLKSRWHDELLNKADLVKEKLGNLCRTHEQIKLVKENFMVVCAEIYTSRPLIYGKYTPTESNVSRCFRCCYIICL